MRRYLAVDIADQIRTKGAQAGLVDALYRRAQLKLEYDAATTKTAAEAFDARSGNCLSLVLMTAALAHELQLSVRYQSAYMEEAWSRNGNLLFASGHVNITLGRRMLDAGTMRDYSPWTIDFLPADEIRTLRVRDIDESTVLAMYANNRAAEALARGKLDDAYAWAAEALRKDPTFMNSYNTLGVVYLRHSNLGAGRAGVRLHPRARPEEHPGAGQPRRNLHPAGAAGRCRGGAHPAGGDRGGAAVPLLQPRPRRRPAERLAHRPRLLRPRGGTRRLLPRVPLLARPRRLAARQRRPGAQAPAAGDGQQHHPRPARSLRRQAGLAAVAAEARAGRRPTGS